MSTEKTWETVSTSYENTLGLGERVGSRLKGGEVIELIGDLGAGKTAFTTGLAKGILSKDSVGSPTFTISKLYKGSKLTMHHFDFYRLPEAGLMSEQIQEVVDDPSSVLVLEWAGAVEDVLPKDRVKVFLNRDATSEDTRNISFHYSSNLEYLIEGIGA